MDTPKLAAKIPLTLEELYPPVVPAGYRSQMHIGGTSLPLPPVTPAIPFQNQYIPQLGLRMGMGHRGR